MKQLSRILVIGLLTAMAGFSASAQEFKVGVVNLDRIFREANSAKAAQTKLEQEFSKREKEIGDLATQLKTSSDKFEREAPTLAESQRTVRQRQLIDLDRTFQTKRREFQEDLSTRKNEELQQVIERANKVVKALAESEKYDLILQESVYVSPKHDITDKVIKALNATR
jgi:outer membrane protein